MILNMKIHYNSPVILTYTIICIAVIILNNLFHIPITKYLFTVYPGFNFLNPLDYFRLFSHIIGHISWAHLLSNFSMILLIGPLLEEKYGSGKLLEMIAVTAFITGLLNTILFTTGLLGASGVVFMLILLGSFSNLKSGHIPLTFILVAFLFLGSEIIKGCSADNISQFAHLIGGAIGAVYGYYRI